MKYRENLLSHEKRVQEQALNGSTTGNYTLTFEQAIAILDEEHRIFKDWLKVGNVNPDEFDRSEFI